MILFRTLAAAALMLGSSLALADVASHAKAAEQVLKLTRVDQMSAEVYRQVQHAFEQRYAEQGVTDKQALLERYQAKGKAALDKGLAWDKLKPQIVRLYTDTYSEQELNELIAFYQSPLGSKLLDTLPAITMQSARLTQQQVQQVAPEVNKLLTEMSTELAASKP
jgi:hypothetical protein